MLSGYTSVGSARYGIDIGVDAYMMKPMESEKILELVPSQLAKLKMARRDRVGRIGGVDFILLGGVLPAFRT